MARHGEFWLGRYGKSREVSSGEFGHGRQVMVCRGKVGLGLLWQGRYGGDGYGKLWLVEAGKVGIGLDRQGGLRLGR